MGDQLYISLAGSHYLQAHTAIGAFYTKDKWTYRARWVILLAVLGLLTPRSSKNIIATVQEAMGNGCLHSIVDASAGSWPFLQANELAHLGLRCADLRGKRWPDLVGEAWGVIDPLMKAILTHKHLNKHVIGQSLSLWIIFLHKTQEIRRLAVSS